MNLSHICLLSEQPTPNICPLLDRRTRADEVVFVVSEQQRPRLEHLRPVLKRYHIAVRELPIRQAYGAVMETQQAIEGEIGRLREAGRNVLVNATGGTKPMAIAAHMAAFNLEVPAFYVHADRLDWLYLPPDTAHTPFELEERLKLPDFLRTYGFDSQLEPRSYLDGSEGLLHDLLIRPDAYASGVSALNFHAARAGNHAKLRSELQPGDPGNRSFQEVLDLFGNHGLLEIRNNALHFGDEERRFFCAGGWLEQHVLDTLHAMRGRLGARLNDLQGSVTVSALDARTRPVKNEIDVAVLYDNALHTIECKARVFASSRRPEEAGQAATQALYKLATLRRELGGIRARAMLVSYQPVQPHHRERAAALDIKLIAGNDLRHLSTSLRRWLEPAAA